jgi:cell wall-associated NlpC family hydrolase
MINIINYFLIFKCNLQNKYYKMFMKTLLLALLVSVSFQMENFLQEENEEVLLGASGYQIVDVARTKLGCSYVYGAAGPSTFDCSGLSSWVFKQFGISIPRTASAQSQSGTYVSYNNLQPGDLVFFNTSGSGVSHVGIYTGNGKMIHAPKTGDVVKEVTIHNNSYWTPKFVTARRYY